MPKPRSWLRFSAPETRSRQGGRPDAEASLVVG
jgi:hypothetical protein